MVVNLSMLAGAGAQFLDNNGNPLSGGKIYTYQAGTTTPLTTYTTNSGTIAHTNPIVLDAAGRVPNGGEIWLTLGIGYKFVVKTSTEVLIATYDNIPSSAQPPAANDADSIMYEQGYTVTAGNFVIGKMYRIATLGTTDFTLIGAINNVIGTHFIATGVGTGTGTAELSQTVENKLRETVSVKDFGAVGDGVTDDTAAIQAAIDYVESQIVRYFFSMQARTIHFPDGQYRTTGQLLVKFPLEFVGDGYSASVIKLDTGVLAPVFRIDGYEPSGSGATLIQNVAVRFSHLGIRGSGWNNNVSGFTTANHGIHLESSSGFFAQYLEVYNCNIRECSGAAIRSVTSQSLRVINSVIQFSCIGINLTGQYNTEFTIDTNIIRQNGRGIVVSPPSGVFFASGRVLNNLIESNLLGPGLEFGAAERQAVGLWLTRCQQIVVDNNYFEGHLNDIYLDTVSQSIFINNNHQSNSLNQLYNWLRTNPNQLMTRQMAAYYVVGTCVGNIIERNFVYKPVKPSNITDTQWGTSVWGSEYEHFPALAGFNSLINNIWIGPSGGVEDVTFAPAAGSGITNYESISNIQFGGTTPNGRLNRNQQVYTGAYRHALETTQVTQLFKIARGENFSPGRIRLMANRTQATKFDVEYAKCDSEGVQDPAYTAVQIARVVEDQSVVGWGFPKASGFYMEDQANRFVAIRMDTAAPSTGTWKVGDQVWNQTPTAGGNIGWVCVTAGTPGTWKTFGTIAS